MKLKIYSSREIYLKSENRVREFFSRIHWQPKGFEYWIEHERKHFEESIKRGYSPKYVVTYTRILGKKYCNIEVKVEGIKCLEDFESIACAPGKGMSESDEEQIRRNYYERKYQKRLEGVVD